MTTARLLSPRPLSEWREDNRRVLQRDLVVDLGVVIPELWGFPGVETEISTIITIPAGFDHDGSSIPAALPVLLAWIMGDEDDYEIAGIVHDYLWRIGAPYAAANRVWRIVARSGRRHVGALQGFLGWAGLMLGGWASYRQRARERRERRG